MPKTKRAKKDESSDSDSGPEDRGPAEKKIATSSSSTSSSSKMKKNAEGEIAFQLDKSKFVKVREFRGKVLIDIREFYEKDGEMRPGKKGIALNAANYQKLKELLPDIDEALKQF